MNALPNTVLIGAPKAGTTSLCHDLQGHPDIYMYPSKETHFFSYNYNQGIEHYRSLFRPSGETIVMEASPEYSARGRSETSVARMREHIPDARIIYMVRHPLRRLESEYVQELANGFKPIAFRDAVFDWKLLEGSLYEKNYLTFCEAFAPERIHVVFFEDYVADKPRVISDLLRFLGVEQDPAIYATRAAKNTREEKIVDPPLVKTLRRIGLIDRFKHHIPDSLKLWLKRRISQPVDADIVWDDALLAKILPEVSRDAANFLKRCGKQTDYWFSSDI